MRQLDITSAYLNDDSKEKIFTVVLNFLTEVLAVITSTENRDRELQRKAKLILNDLEKDFLQKSYGLHQAGRK